MYPPAHLSFANNFPFLRYHSRLFGKCPCLLITEAKLTTRNGLLTSTTHSSEETFVTALFAAAELPCKMHCAETQRVGHSKPNFF